MDLPEVGVHAVDEFLQIDTLRSENAVLLRLVGELDMATAPLVDHAVATALAGHPHRLRLDLTGVTFCDVAGLRALRRLTDTAHTAQATLHLTGISPHLRRTLTWIGAATPWSPPVLLS